MHEGLIVQHIEAERRTIAELVLDREQRRNALTPPLLGAMLAAARAAAEDPAVHAIILRGHGPTFCAGFDLDACAADPEALPTLLRDLASLMHTLRTAPKPVVVGVQGGAMAGAAAILTAADLVVADMNATLGYPVVRLGISPAVSAPGLMRSIGAGPARARLLNPEVIDADRAHQLGWAHMLVPVPEDVRPRAQIEAARLAAKPPHAFAVTKHWLNEVDGSLHEPSRRAALEASLSLTGGPEQQRLLHAAIASKR